MFCSNCGAKVDPAYKFCPDCGTKMDLPAHPPADSSDQRSSATAQETPTVKHTKKPMPFWYKLVIFLAVLALIGVTAGILYTESFVDVIDKQLEALRHDEVEKAYSTYTSKDFKAATSLDQFRNFVQAYPVFLNNKSAHFSQRSVEHNIAILKGHLTSSDNVNTPIEYKLIKEDGKWKILIIRLLKPQTIQNAKNADHTEDLITVVKALLVDIQQKKFADAYQNYMSNEFKEATSEQAFEDFIKRYSILEHHRVVSFHKPTIRNGIGTLSVILQSDEVAAYVKYYLIYEDQKWKVWSMRILSPSEEHEKADSKENTPGAQGSALGAMSFGSITLGEHVDQQGLIKLPETTFKSSLGDLYVDIEVKNGEKGSTVYLSLQHLESGTSIPAKAAIEENGDTMLMSVFSPPSSGWPKGNYKLIVTSSSGLNKIIDFQIQ